ncbi:hypothetical protein PIB30_085899 [Stylosanthes scabra]|uniref:Uncharacterized protein n=1 Tax=Stylosanthes scabra TaxID=79078 RepID=A0ABU6VSN4_9FABA|nr:hypothetical protein [Stylosanthes scabra]
MIAAKIACLRGVLQSLEGLDGIGSQNYAETPDNATMVVAGIDGIAVDFDPLHCLLRLEAWVGPHRLHLAAVGVHFLPFCNDCHVVRYNVFNPYFFSFHDCMNQNCSCHCYFRFVPGWNKGVNDKLLPSPG